jgi:glycosyltransferase involved in cell wall biosynthesis
MQPIGGTELQYNLLYQHVDNNLLDNFQITTSVPEKIPLAKDKINILWIQNSYDQPNLAPWFKDPSNHEKYSWYVFNSHWCAEKYRMMFKVPPGRCTVIKNAIAKFPNEIKQHKKGDPIKLFFSSTPWRGLNVLLGAMQKINNPAITCEVFSSTKIYGSSFEEQNNSRYQPLFDQAEKLQNVNFHGFADNDKVLDKLNECQIFTYPNIWEETSCISAIEALSYGLHGIVTNYGALFETCSEWPTYIQYDRDYKKLAEAFAYAISGIAEQIHTDGMYELQKSQANFYKKFYNWKNRQHEWTQFLEGAANG